MAFCSFSKNAAMFDATPIENIFLLEYLPTAPDEFLRVYLYARMLCLHPELGGDIADVAKALRMEEENVFNAFAYWEQQGLVERLTDRPPTYAVLPVKYDTVCQTNPMERDYYEYRDFNASLQEIFGSKYLLGPKQYKTANDWLNLDGFTKDAVLRMIEYARSLPGGKTPVSVFKRAEELAFDWAARGIKTLEDVEKTIEFEGRVSNVAQLVMQQFSSGRRPSVAELKLVKEWLEWGLTEEEIIAGCDKTISANSPTFKYLHGILKNRIEQKKDYYNEVKEVLRELGAGHSTPTAHQKDTYAALLESGFEPETILLAAAQCAKHSRNNFSELEKKLRNWKEKGKISFEQAKAYLAEVDKLTLKVNQLLEKAGSSESASSGDLSMYARWKESHSDALIEYAAECAFGAKFPMSYMSKLLTAWKNDGVTTPEQAKARPAAKADNNPAAKNQQKDYVAEEITDDFYYDFSNDFGEGSNKK